MDQQKEQWKDEVLNSTRQMSKASPSPFLFTHIEARLEKFPAITGKQLGWATFTLVVLLAMNTFAMIQGKRQTTTSSEYTLSSFNSY